MSKKTLLVFGIFIIASLQFAGAQSPPTLNGYQLNASQARWVEFIAKEMAPKVGADVAARGTWWTLKEGVLDVTSPETPIGYSNCAPIGNEYRNFLYDKCGSIWLWQVGIAAVQVPNHSADKVLAKARQLHPELGENEIIGRVAELAGYSKGSKEYNGAISSTGYLRQSLLMRDPAIGFALVDENITPCLSVAGRAALGDNDWCQGYGAAASIARDVNTTNNVIKKLADYYKNFSTGATPPSPSEEPEEQKEVSLGLAQQIGNFYAWALGIGGLIALGVLIFGGILYTTSAGNASRQDDAKQWVTGAFVGLIILFGSWFILNTINPELTKLTDLKLLANRATGGLSGNQDNTSNDDFSSYPVINGQTCPVPVDSFDWGSGCGAPREGIDGGHQGLDLMAKSKKVGDPLYAIEDGVIDPNMGYGWNKFGGWRFWLRADSGNSYYYAHTLSRETLPTQGKKVRAGERVSYVGESGNGPEGTYGQVGGPHLHIQWVPTAGGPVCGKDPYVDVIPLIRTICNPNYVPAETTQSPELAQVLDKPQYSNFGVSFQEIGGQGASNNSSQSFASASLYKLFVAQWLYEQREKGLSFSQKIPLVGVSANIAENSSDGIANVDFFWKELPGGPADDKLVSIQECLAPMIQWSDNVCGWSLRDYARKGGLDSYLAGQGYKSTSIGDLTTSPSDVSLLLVKVAQGNMVNQAASQELYSLMLGQKHRYKIPRGVPSGAQVANKTGELHRTYHSHDAAVIKYSGKTYVLVVMTKGQSPDPAATSAINRTISQLTTELFGALK